MKIAGETVKKLLEKAGYTVFWHKVQVADEKTVQAAQDLIVKEKINIALGIGGGTAIDVAKLSSSRENIPFISVPTAPSHDGIASPIASIKGDGGFKSCPTTSPIPIIADTPIIVTA